MCSRCRKEPKTTGSYCKYYKSIIESKRRYKSTISKISDLDELYKFQRSFLYRLITSKNRTLDFCSEVMEYSIEELESALHYMGYYEKDFGLRLLPINNF